MDTFKQLLAQFGRLFKWWVIIVPWEQVVRVRLGKHLKVLDAGIHLKIPYIDLVYRQSTRQRVARSDMQTITTKDGQTITLASQIVYAIGDVERLYNSLHHPEDTIIALVQSGISKFVVSHELKECNPGSIERYLSSDIDFTSMGLTGVNFCITNFAIVDTYRLIMDTAREWRDGPSLQTNYHEDTTGL